MRSGNAIPSHAGFIPFEIVYETIKAWFDRFRERRI